MNINAGAHNISPILVAHKAKSIANKHLFVVFAASIAALGGFLFGYDTGVISGALIYIQQSFTIGVWTQEFIVSSVVLAALLGAITSGRLADVFGRRKMLIWAAIGFIVGTAFTVIANDTLVLVLGRFIIGLAIGVSSYTTPLFISEIAPNYCRGALVLLNAIAITGGESAAFLVDYFLVPTQSWRLMFATGLVPALLLFLGMLFMPATPRWMIIKGYLKGAYHTLARIRRHKDINPEFEEIKKSITARQGTWKPLFSKTVRPALVIGLTLGVLQQFVGINTVIYYGPFIFKAMGFHNTSAQILATFVMGLTNTLMSIVAVILIDIVGRRRLLIGGMVIATFSLIIIGLQFNFYSPSIFSHKLSLLLMITYIAGYSISIGSLFWLIISEIYPLYVRGLAMSFVTGIQWLANFIVSTTFLTILDTIGASNTFWLFGSICALTVVISYFIVPETKGVPLEQIEANLKAKQPMRKLGTVTTDVSLYGRKNYQP